MEGDIHYYVLCGSGRASILLATLHKNSYEIKNLSWTSSTPLFLSLPPLIIKSLRQSECTTSCKASSLSLLVDIWWKCEEQTGHHLIQLFLKSPMLLSSFVFSKALILNPGSTLSPGQLKNAHVWALPIGCFAWMCLGWGPIGNFSNLLRWV